jgi:hypothetical protein
MEPPADNDVVQWEDDMNERFGRPEKNALLNPLCFLINRPFFALPPLSFVSTSEDLYGDDNDDDEEEKPRKTRGSGSDIIIIDEAAHISPPGYATINPPAWDFRTSSSIT